MTDLIAKLEAATGPDRGLGRRFEVAENGCWLWTGALDEQRRGRVWIGDKLKLAHRAVWEAINGPIPAGKLLCHHCDDPQCVNPAHVYVGTHADNVRDMVVRKRSYAARNPEKVRELGRKLGARDKKGERNPRAKLTLAQAVFVRSDARPTKLLAQIYGVNRTTIQRIRSGKQWPALKAREAG